MYGCVEKVVIKGVIPCMPRGSLILVTLSSSFIPQIPIHIDNKQKCTLNHPFYLHFGH